MGGFRKAKDSKVGTIQALGDFERRFVLAEPESKPMIQYLRKDEICCVYPTIHTVRETVKEKPLSDREKRMVSHHSYRTL